MPISYKRKNTMKKSKSSKGSKSSKLSKRVKTRKSTKTKKRLTRKSKKRSVVRKMRGGVDPDDVSRATTNATNPNTLSSLPGELIPNLITDLQSMLNLSQTNKQFQTLINKDLMHFINSGFDKFPDTDKNFITLMRTKMDRFKTLKLAEIMLLFKYYKTDVFNFTNLYVIDSDDFFNNYLFFMKNNIKIFTLMKIYYMHIGMTLLQFNNLITDFKKLQRIDFNNNNINFEICLSKLNLNKSNAVKAAIYFKKFYNIEDEVIYSIIVLSNQQNLFNLIHKKSMDDQKAILNNIKTMIDSKLSTYISYDFVIKYAVEYTNTNNQTKIDNAITLVTDTLNNKQSISGPARDRFNEDVNDYFYEKMENQLFRILSKNTLNNNYNNYY